MSPEPQASFEDGASYRVHRMETDIAEIKASVMSVQASVAQIQMGMHEMYVPRREFESFKTDLDKDQRLEADRVEKAQKAEAERIEKVQKAEKERVDERLSRTERVVNYAVAVTVGALLTAIFTLVRSVIGA